MLALPFEEILMNRSSIALVLLMAGGVVSAQTPAPSIAAPATTPSVGQVLDHHGQMAVYLRLSGIIPPASRKP
jgi:hypothetical protein